ncbi:hypothetical protein NCCP2222_01900 [Sporosarcina sp. NCCP-2222]|uniref:hypothetical protein n=1 Tax=Sporosarcina sp. NCCP-2222 TaxID=2935073 RepID=UPI00208A4DF5|nr:hypothetical protein [Sporosarcina sp. NCCP-2222]GKV54243.1 hypothetical protein NCCP2222_01900 [Sporosarcina sp. NCCP-2222]
MEPTVLDVKRLRLMVNDPIPVGVGESPLFTDEELALMFLEHSNVFSLAAEIWTIKAGLFDEEIKGYSSGNEKYELTSIKDRSSYALAMAKHYADKAEELVVEEENTGSLILKFQTPDVM